MSENSDTRKFEDWWEDRNIGEKVVLVIGFVILGIGLLFLFGYVVMLLWNWLMPEIFGLKSLTYWQAWGVLALSCILFGKIGGAEAAAAATGSAEEAVATSASRAGRREEVGTADMNRAGNRASRPDGHCPPGF
jgi:hypothetical protein